MPDYAQDGGDALRRDLVKRGILEGAKRDRTSNHTSHRRTFLPSRNSVTR